MLVTASIHGAAQTPAPAAAGEDERLAWVNPARCLPSCAYNPVARLIRVNDRGLPDRRGRHRVDAAARPALTELMAAAAAAGHRLKVQSGFRSYQDQARVFAATKEIGRAARPGHSEHQLGTAVDLRLPTTAAIEWLAANVPNFGFVLSYPPGHQRVTGYRPEPWHIRFVGPALAKEVQAQSVSLEELFRARPELGQSGTCADCPRRTSIAPCKGVSPAGRCDGDVLVWCYDGAVAAVDCASSNEHCAGTDGGEYNCR
jgi:LAS superfamily LD-carboxypeptidase LdcB